MAGVLEEAPGVGAPVVLVSPSKRGRAVNLTPIRAASSSEKPDSTANLTRLAGFCWGLTTVNAVVGHQTWQRRKGGLRAKKVITELLVDADGTSLDLIQAAVEYLRCGSTVRTTLFAPPGRMQNRQWKQLVEISGFKFKAVQRNAVYGDPNDEAIQRTLRTVAGNFAIARVALITSDTDFVQDMKTIALAGKKALVFISSKYVGTIQDYERAGVTVVPLEEVGKNTMYKVRAILRNNGSGFVEMCEPVPHAVAETEVAMLREILSRQGYVQSEKVFLPAAVAKFFYTNSLGALTVYPAVSCFLEAYDVVGKALGSPEWNRYQDEVAFFCPVTAAKPGPSKLQTYGTEVGWRVYQAGGPFVLTQHTDLVMEALQRLGFVDGDFNYDVKEAFLVFANTGANKKLLRKMQSLPEHSDSTGQLAAKFKQAFLSTSTCGQWQKNPSDSHIRRLLAGKTYINDMTASKGEVFEAMQHYSKKLSLPVRKTYNGLVWQLLQHVNQKDPSRRTSILL